MNKLDHRPSQSFVSKLKNFFSISPKLVSNPGWLNLEQLEERQMLSSVPAGSLDPSFGDNGWASFNETYLSHSVDGASELVDQGDGKFLALAAGYVARYSTDGSIDPTFGLNGFVQFADEGDDVPPIVDFGDDGGFIQSYADYHFGDVVVAKYDSDGQLDDSFGVEGISRVRLTNEEPGYNRGEVGVNDVFIDDNNHIVVATSIRSSANVFTGGGSDTSYSFIRLDESGLRDHSFGTEGAIQLEGLEAYYATEQSDGKTIWFGRPTENGVGGSNYVLFRLGTDYSLDPTFGIDGFYSIPESSEPWGGRNPIVLQNDKILLLGGSSEFWTQRLNADGSVDSTFGNNGIITTDLQLENYPNASAESAIELSDGGILVVGDARINYENTMFAAVRYDSLGNIVESFGNNGVFALDVFEPINQGSDRDRGLTAMELPDGRLLIAGRTGIQEVDQEFASNQTAFIKLTSGGELDTTFGDDGVLISNLAREVLLGYNISGLTTQADGKILASGFFYRGRGGERPAFVARFNVDGTKDLSFANNGVAEIDLRGYDEGKEVVVQPDGKIVVAGFSWNVNTSDRDAGFMLARFDTSGNLDASFGVDGIAEFNPTDANVYGETFEMLANGSFLVGGIAYSSSGGNGLVMKFTSNGQIDTSFGSDGRSYVADQVYDLKVEADGKILVNERYDTNYDITRLNPDGSVNQFLSSPFSGTPAQIGLQSDGKIIVAGRYNDGTYQQFGVVRYLTNGAIDTSFGTAGLATMSFDDSDPFVNRISGLQIDGDGNIIVSGYTNGRFRIFRYTSSGDLDTSFGDNGDGTIYYSPFGFERSYGELVLTADNQLYVGGSIKPGGSIARVFNTPVQNSQPIAHSNAYSTYEDALVSGNLIEDAFGGLSDSSPIGGDLQLASINGVELELPFGQSISLASGATISVARNGDFTYNPNGQFDDLSNGDQDTDGFTYQITNVYDQISNLAQVTITIDGVGETIVANDDFYQSDVYQRIEGNVAENDIVPNQSVLSFEIENDVTNGTLNLLENGKFVYRPTPGFIGLDQFTYTISNGAGQNAEATVSLESGNVNITDGQLAYWNFDQEFKGEVLDIANSINGVDDNATLHGAKLATGIFGNAGSFDGINDFAYVTTSTELENLDLQAGRSVSLWFNADELPTDGSHQVLFETGNHHGMNIYIQDGILHVGAWRRNLNNPMLAYATFLSTEPNEIQVNKWHHVGLRLVNGTLTGFLDGIQFHETQDENAGRAVNHVAYLGIGASYRSTVFHDVGRVFRNGHFFKGKIDDVRLFNRGLNDGEFETFAAPDITSDLNVHFTADETAGTMLRDSSVGGSSNHGTLFGAEFVDNGFKQTAIEFDGNEDFVKIDNSPDINTSRIEQRTVSLWFNVDQFNESKQVIYKQGIRNGFNIYLDDNNLVVGGFRNGSWEHFFNSSEIEAGTWHQVVFVLDNDNQSFSVFLDGEQIGTGAADFVPTATGQISLGRMRGGARFESEVEFGSGHAFAGRIDEVRMYDRALTEEEVQSLYERE